jgi:murein L,D-transpeptidase YcbB/YkuD
MREVVFRPFWDVPRTIARGELLPIIRRRPDYLQRESLEIVRGGDHDAEVYPVTDENLERVAAGTLRLRQRPGPANALGLVKFVFPNRYNVYMHGTPAQGLFASASRDFSHGCIRVEDPGALAEYVLRGQPEWSRDAIDEAMHGDSTIRVPLARPVAVYILYATAVVREDGVVHFYPDLYGHDAALELSLESASAPSSRQTAPTISRD